MKGKVHINGIILAGGKSERMGTPKAFLEYKGKPFICHCIEALKPLVEKIIIVSDDPRFNRYEIERITDAIQGVGPAGGIYSGLTHSDLEYNLILSCDVPTVKTASLQLLVNAMEEGIDLVQFESEGNAHPLIALYRKQCASHFKKALEEDERRVRKIIAPFNVKTLKASKEVALQLKNINTQQEYKALKHEIDY